MGNHTSACKNRVHVTCPRACNVQARSTILERKEGLLVWQKLQLSYRCLLVPSESTGFTTANVVVPSLSRLRKPTLNRKDKTTFERLEKREELLQTMPEDNRCMTETTLTSISEVVQFSCFCCVYTYMYISAQEC